MLCGDDRRHVRFGGVQRQKAEGADRLFSQQLHQAKDITL